MELIKKSEWFVLDRPIGEPDVKYFEDNYCIERLVTEKGETIWFGLGVNWKKEKDGDWTVLTTDKNAKPLPQYLPDIVYGEDRIYFAPCPIPIYESLYLARMAAPGESIH